MWPRILAVGTEIVPGQIAAGTNAPCSSERKTCFLLVLGHIYVHGKGPTFSTLLK
jgi:hypothetical protein